MSEFDQWQGSWAVWLTFPKPGILTSDRKVSELAETETEYLAKYSANTESSPSLYYSVSYVYWNPKQQDRF